MYPAMPFAHRQPPPGVDLLAIEVAGTQLTALRAEPKATRRGAVLLLPGYTSSKEEFYGIAPLLSAMGWEAWAYSHRGQADSGAPLGVENYRLAGFVGDAVAIAHAIQTDRRDRGADDPVHIVGHSFGGVIAAHAAITAPELFASLTMMSAGAHAVTAPWVMEAIVSAATRGGLARWQEKNPGLAPLSDAELPPDDAFRRARMATTSSDHLVGAAAVLHAFDDLTPGLEGLGMPIHVLHGERDDVWPAELQKRTAERLDAHYTCIPGVGHSVPREAAGAAAAAIVGFLENLSRT